MNKILYTATSDIHLKTFHFPYLKWFIDEGYEVHVAVEKRADINLDFCHKVHYLPFKRNPLNLWNVNAFFSLRDLINKYNYKLIHCHTPSVSLLTRLAAIQARRRGTKLLYTAHGYHFFKGAQLKMWLVYYPVEKWLSFLTDGIVLINREDYELTKSNFFNKYSLHLKGIGIDTERFVLASDSILHIKRNEINITTNDFIILYIAEFIPRKNHEFLIRATSQLLEQVPNAKLLFAGQGILLKKMKVLANKLGVENSIRFLGWRADISQLSQLSHIGVSASKQEGLGLGLAEEMYFNLPIVASKDRGHKEMITHGENGFMFNHGDTNQFVHYIKLLYEDKNLYKKFSRSAFIKAQEFLIESSLKTMGKFYNQFLQPKS